MYPEEVTIRGGQKTQHISFEKLTEAVELLNSANKPVVLLVVEFIVEQPIEK